MGMINFYIIRREKLRDERNKTPNGFQRNEHTKEMGRLQVSIKYYIKKFFLINKGDNKMENNKIITEIEEYEIPEESEDSFVNFVNDCKLSINKKLYFLGVFISKTTHTVVEDYAKKVWKIPSLSIDEKINLADSMIQNWLCSLDPVHINIKFIRN